MRTWAWLLIIFIAYVAVINAFNVSDLSSDEARHSNQGLIIKDYVHTVLTKGYVPYRTYVDEGFTALYPQAGYPALYDPPLHAIWQAMFFAIFGSSVLLARLSNQALVGLLLPLGYLFFKQVLPTRRQALLAMGIFLVLPPVFGLARQAMLSVPVALLTAGWWALTFREQEMTPKEMALRVIGGGLCLMGASLMMYQTLIYVPLFMVAYTVWIFFAERKKLLSHFGTSKVFVMLLQSVIVALPVLWWFSISLRDAQTFQLLLRAGTQEVKGGAPGTVSYVLSFLIQLLEQTYYTVLLVIPALFTPWARKRKHLLLFVLITLLSATLVLSNRQLRYITHLLPAIAALMTIGLYQLAALTQQKRQATILLLVLLIGGLLGLDVHAASTYAHQNGVETPAYEWLSSQPEPRTIINLEIDADHESIPYMHTPDTVLFHLLSMDEPGQSGAYMKVDSVRSVAIAVDVLKASNLYVIVLDPMRETPLGQDIHEFFSINGFTPFHAAPYTIYAHPFKGAKQQHFTSIVAGKRSVELINEGERAFDEKDYVKAVKVLEEALSFDPLNIRLRIALSATYASIATQLLDKDKEDAAREAFAKSRRVYPWILEFLKDEPMVQKLTPLLTTQAPATGTISANSSSTSSSA